MEDKESSAIDIANELVESRQSDFEPDQFETDTIRRDDRHNFIQSCCVKIFNSSKDAVAFTTLDGLIVDVNDSFLNLTATSRDEVVNKKRIIDFIPKDNSGFHLINLMEIIKTKQPSVSEVLFENSGGRSVPLQLSIHVISGGEGIPSGLAFVIRQISDPDKRRNDLEIINTITQAVHQSINLEDVFKIALDMTIKLENIDMVMIYLVDREKKEAILKAFRNVPKDYINRAGRIPYPRGITWKVITTGKMVNVEDAQKHPLIGSAGRDLGHHGILGIPITQELEVTGVIWFISYAEHKFDKREIKLLSSIGNQIALAIVKASLYRELSKKNRNEKIINLVTKSVHKSLNLEEVLENAVDAMSKFINGVDNVSIYLVEGEEAVLKSFRSYSDRFFNRLRRIPYPRGFTWKTIIEGEASYCADVEHDSVIGEAGVEAGTMSYASMPIHNEGKTIGCININSLKKNAFDKDELTLLEIVARQIEVAINNAQIAEALRRSEERLNAFFNAAPIGLAILDSQLRFIRINETLAHINGLSVKDHLGKTLRDVVPDLAPTLEPFYRKVLKTSKPIFNTLISGETQSRPGCLQHWVATYFPTTSGRENLRRVGVIVVEITERKKIEEQLIDSREQLRALSTRLQSVREEERTKIAREIHDELGQALAGLKLSLSWMDRKLHEIDNTKPFHLVLQEIESMSNLLDDTIQTVRRISTELRPRVLDELGLVEAIEWQVQEFEARTKIKCRLSSNQTKISLDQERNTAIFRIFQETLTNIARHAEASRINIKLRKKSGFLILEVKDNGKGISEHSLSRNDSLGLLGMRERALLFGGNVKINGNNAKGGKGTTVTVQIPIESKNDAVIHN
jgi:PAS domain S-box-containing protein